MNKETPERTDTVVDPRAMVVELGDALVAGVTVLGPQRSPDDTRRTELVKVECLRLSQLKDRLQHR